MRDVAVLYFDICRNMETRQVPFLDDRFVLIQPAPSDRMRLMSGRGRRRIVIPGGSGQVGTLLARHFQEKDDDVTVITRHPQPAEWKPVAWTGYDLGPWIKTIDGCDVVINLAGRSVNCRYNAAN